MEETKVTLKILVDSKANKVLFAEAGKDFVDFLFHILSLPVSTIVKLLSEKGTVGSLGALYKSIESLSPDYFQPNLDKDVVLKPRASVNVPLLELSDSMGRKRKRIYRCGSHKKYVSHDRNAICPVCGERIRYKNVYVSPQNEGDLAMSSVCQGYVKGVVTYLVMDNLEVTPMSTMSSITVMNKFRVKDVSSLVEKQVQVGMAEGLAMLKASFEVSNTVLTTVFLSKKA